MPPYDPCDACGCSVGSCVGQQQELRDEIARLRDALARFAAGKVHGQTIPPLEDMAQVKPGVAILLPLDQSRNWRIMSRRRDSNP